MQLKHVVFMVIVVVYAGYYFGISKGFINKEMRYGKEDEPRTAVQRVVDAVTPDSPEEKCLKNKDKLEDLYFQLNLAKKNYESYDNWITDSIKYPPLCETGREQMRKELENDKRPEMKARIEEYEKKIAELEGK